MLFWKYFRKYSTKYARYFYSGFVALAITDIFDVIPPLIVMRGVDQITNGASQQELFKTALIFFGVTLCLAFIRYWWRILIGNYHQNVARELREDIFNKFSCLGPSFYTKNQTGELMSLVTNDVEAVRMGMGPGIVVLSDSLFYLLTIPPIMIYLSPKLTWQTLVMLPFLPLFVSWLGKVINKLFLFEQEKFSELSGFVQENISGQRTVKSFAQEKNQSVLFNKLSNDLRLATGKVALAETFMHPVMEFCVSVGVVILLALGTDDVVKGAITIGTFVAFQRYISKMIWPMTAIGWGFSLVSQGSASLKRIDNFLNEPLDIENTGGKLPQNLSIKIKDLSFKYPDRPEFALKKINLEIKEGEKIGITGPVAGGKTTLVQLLTRLYQVPSGHIYIGNEDINHIPLNSLRKLITLVPQDTFLFSQSIKNNLLYGASENLDVDRVMMAAKQSQVHEEINILPENYEAILGERGINLSGGQKQRLAIARGLLRNSPIIIFDDSFSAVDTKTEKAIIENLFSHFENQTAIVISHKIENLELCDRILTIKDGEVYANS